MSLVSGIQYSTEFKSRKNAFINGNFDIWQRGTSHSSQLYGSADRWGIYRIGTGVTQTMSQQTFTLGQTDVPNNPKYYCRHVVASGTDVATQARMFQGIEDVKTFAGETVTISFWAKASAALDISLSYYQGFGTGGTPSTEVQGPIEKISLTTSWAKYTVTTTIPSISGKTLGTANDSQLSINFWMSCGSNFATLSSNIGIQSGTFELSQIQIEPGDVATEFERRHIAEELALCERYFERHNSDTLYSSAGSGFVRNASSIAIEIPYNVMKREVPTITFSSLSHYVAQVATSGIAITSISGQYNSRDKARLVLISSGLTTGQGCQLEANTAAGYIDIDAEL